MACSIVRATQLLIFITWDEAIQNKTSYLENVKLICHYLLGKLRELTFVNRQCSFLSCEKPLHWLQNPSYPSFIIVRGTNTEHFEPGLQNKQKEKKKEIWFKYHAHGNSKGSKNKFSIKWWLFNKSFHIWNEKWPFFFILSLV